MITERKYKLADYCTSDHLYACMMNWLPGHISIIEPETWSLDSYNLTPEELRGVRDPMEVPVLTVLKGLEAKGYLSSIYSISNFGPNGDSVRYLMSETSWLLDAAENERRRIESERGYSVSDGEFNDILGRVNDPRLQQRFRAWWMLMEHCLDVEVAYPNVKQRREEIYTRYPNLHGVGKGSGSQMSN